MNLFATQLYQGRIAVPRGLEETCLGLAADDTAGRRWSRDAWLWRLYLLCLAERPDDARQHHRRAGAAALPNMWRVSREALQFDLGGRKLRLDSLWINVMNKGAIHAPHIHPHSAISGTYYVTVPPKSGAIRFEDPRLGLMMAAPPRKKTARTENRSFVDVAPRPGMLLLWESWLRHGVEPNQARAPRISVSFNYS